MRKFLKSFFKKKSNIKEEIYKSNTLPKIEEFQNTIKTKDEISFLHYGHLGDIINSLPAIKEISKNKQCILYIQKNKLRPLSFF